MKYIVGLSSKFKKVDPTSYLVLGVNNLISTSTNIRGTFAAASTPITPKTKPEADSKADVSTESGTNAKRSLIDSEDSIDKSDETAKNDTSSSDITKTEEVPKELKDSEKNAATVTDTTPASGVTSARGRVWNHVASDCLACARIRPPSSHELREAFFAGEIWNSRLIYQYTMGILAFSTFFLFSPGFHFFIIKIANSTVN